MEVRSPDIVYIQKYHQYFDANFIKSKEYNRRPAYYNTLIKKSAFYRTPKSSVHNILTYLTRKSACDKTSIQDEQDERYRKALESLKTIKKASIDDYMKNRPGSTGLFNQYGDIKPNDLRALRKQLSTIKTNIYEGVLSFTPEYSEKVIHNKQEAYELLKEVMPKYFKDKGLDPNNMTYFAAYHNNTNHKHCHIIFFENEPSRYLQNGKPGNIRYFVKDLNHFKELVALARPMERDYIYLRDPVIKSMESESTNKQYQSFLNDVRKVIEDKKQYSRCNNNEKQVIQNYAKFIYEHSSNFRTNYDNMMKALDKRQDEIIKNYEMLHLKPTPYALNFAATRKDELNTRLYNQIMKTAKATPLLYPDLKKHKGFNYKIIKDEKLTRTINFTNKTLDKAYKGNASRYLDIKKLPFTTKVHMACVIDSYSQVINSERIWREIEEDRRRLQASVEQDYGRERNENE
ncbi:MAG: relaxase MobL, partial [Bacilli bacterium]|nr:relaxase MobL [Bacilli bacterium]